MTAHRSQGQTLPQVVIDLESCRGTEALYVMISHVRSLKDLLILRPFQQKKICCSASEDFRIENRRLSLLTSDSSHERTHHLSANIDNCGDDIINVLTQTQAQINNLTTTTSEPFDEHALTTDAHRTSSSDDNNE